MHLKVKKQFFPLKSIYSKCFMEPQNRPKKSLKKLQT
uniref:Uncharacterized protein n=1 Tax=Anguilla anguilla TaxID=7936 RepID=A0A0E9T1W0_ANGAN